MSEGVQTGTIRTNIPARLDRLPWSRFHWMVIIGLGTVWILDGSGGHDRQLDLRPPLRTWRRCRHLRLGRSPDWRRACMWRGPASGHCTFGQLTDRYGRKKLFMITLGIYLIATSPHGLLVLAAVVLRLPLRHRMGIGGEYSAINSAIDELIPAKHRGRVDISINGSYWGGAIGGALLAVFALNTNNFAINIGWRLCFALGAVLGLGVLMIRRNVPESPRWLFIHGREDEADEIVRRNRAAGSRSDRRRARGARGEHHRTPAQDYPVDADRAFGDDAVSQAHDPRTVICSSGRPFSTTRCCSASGTCSARSSGSRAAMCLTTSRYSRWAICSVR